MNSKNTRSSGSLKKEVINELHKVENDIDKLERRFTPGQFIDDAIFYSRGANVRSTFDHLKSNPIGTTFLTIGTILLMEDQDHHSYESIVRSKSSMTYDKYKTKVADVKDTIREQLPHKELGPGVTPNKMDMAKAKIESARENLKENFQNVKENVKGMKSNVQESLKYKTEEVKGRAQEKIQDVKSSLEASKEKLGGSEQEMDEGTEFSETSSIREKAYELKDTAQGSFEKARYSVKNRVRNFEPLTYITLGAGLGALTGAGLPLSDKESSFVEEHFGDSISDFSRDLKDALNESANILKSSIMSEFKDYNINLF